VKLKQVILGAALAAFFSPIGQAAQPFRTVIPMKVICVVGGPASMFEILLEKYNERMVAGMRAMIGGKKITMYISENRNNPSASVFLHSSGANQTCLFFASSTDWLHIIETESLPAKKPSSETPEFDS